MDTHRVGIKETEDSEIVTHENITYSEVLEHYEQHHKTAHRFVVYERSENKDWGIYTVHEGGELIQFCDMKKGDKKLEVPDFFKTLKVTTR